MTKQVVKRGPWQIWLMIAMLSGVIVAGFLLFPKTEEQRDRLLSRLGTTNHGEFVLPPVSMGSLTLTDSEGSPWTFNEQKLKWRLLIPGGSECIERCREMLYLSRQVHVSLGKYSRRFERLYLSLDGATSEETSGYIKQNHPFLHIVQGSSKELKELLNSTNTPFSSNNSDEAGEIRAYLVDQQGLVMMSYTLKNKGSEIIEDIEHLMKYSPSNVAN
ncbi:MAG: SCO family protein [Porticoccus sp.]|nr:SCO family protein [Porticoccus sp.]